MGLVTAPRSRFSYQPSPRPEPQRVVGAQGRNPALQRAPLAFRNPVSVCGSRQRSCNLCRMERRSVFRPQRVLIVDDTDDLRALWRLWLLQWGFEVEEARNGAEAVQKARSRPPDLILMDLAMPVLDGREAMRMLAADRATATVPVLAMTAQPSSVAEDSTTERFLPKPTEPEMLLEHIRSTLRTAASAR
jgi:two-component system, cell cycle response regulator DivK